jgi:hypothetical protein
VIVTSALTLKLVIARDYRSKFSKVNS